jgi:hypothetical protein
VKQQMVLEREAAVDEVKARAQQEQGAVVEVWKTRRYERSRRR